jgi:hypothetical protein
VRRKNSRRRSLWLPAGPKGPVGDSGATAPDSHRVPHAATLVGGSYPLTRGGAFGEELAGLGGLLERLAGNAGSEEKGAPLWGGLI